MKFLRTAVFAVFSVLCFSTAAHAANLGGGTVTATALNQRSSPDTYSAVISEAPYGSKVVVAEQAAENWYRVYYNGTEGYMHSDYIEFSETLEGNFGVGYIYGDDTSIWQGPDYESDILGYCMAGTEMLITGVIGDWYKVDYEGSAGYIHSDYMAPSEAISTFPDFSVSETGQIIADTAAEYLGVPYVWAGTSSSGFDCSGFVYYVYGLCGYSVNRTAASLYENGVYVEKEDLQVGDVICFLSGGRSYIGHCGIYIGDGNFIHASSGAGSVVVTSLSTDYYTRNYYGARRII